MFRLLIMEKEDEVKTLNSYFHLEDNVCFEEVTSDEIPNVCGKHGFHDGVDQYVVRHGQRLGPDLFPI